MHHLHLHSELVHSLFYTVHDVFSFHWNGVLQYHHSYRLVWHPYPRSWPLRCRIPPALQVWCHSVHRDIQACLSASHMEYWRRSDCFFCLCWNPSEMFHYSPQQEFQYHDRYSNQSPCVLMPSVCWSASCHSSVYLWWTVILHFSCWTTG